MKKRLRKKKHLGEFEELCFEVHGDLRPRLSRNDLGAFVDRLIDIVEAKSLAFGGGAGRDDKHDGFVTRAGRGSEAMRLEGRARELVEAKLRAEAARLDDAERRLRAAEDDALDLELGGSQREWLVGALRNFGKVWGEMTPEKQGACCTRSSPRSASTRRPGCTASSW